MGTVPECRRSVVDYARSWSLPGQRRSDDPYPRDRVHRALPVPGAARAPRRAATRGEAPDRRTVPGLRVCVRPANLTRRNVRRLHPAVGRQAPGPVRDRALDRGCRRVAQPLPDQGLESRMVSRRRPYRLYRGGRAQGTANLRPVDGRGRRDVSSDPSRRGARGCEVVSGREADRVLDVRPPSRGVEDRHAHAAGWRQLDQGSDDRGPAALPSGPRGLYRAWIRPPLPRSRGRGNAASAHVGRMVGGGPLRRPQGRRGLGLDARRQDHRRRRARRARCRHAVSRLGSIRGRRRDRREAQAQLRAWDLDEPRRFSRRAARRFHRLLALEGELPRVRALCDRSRRCRAEETLGRFSIATRKISTGLPTGTGCSSPPTTRARRTSATPLCPAESER